MNPGGFKSISRSGESAWGDMPAAVGVLMDDTERLWSEPTGGRGAP
jgi:hypothetical protein